MSVASVYLDHNASCPMRPVAFEAMTSALREGGNPSSVHRVGRVGEQVPAARPAHRADEAAAAELGEELLEIGERDLLTLGDVGEGDRLAAAVRGEVDHRHDGVASLGAELHRSSPFTA